MDVCRAVRSSSEACGEAPKVGATRRRATGRSIIHEGGLAGKEGIMREGIKGSTIRKPILLEKNEKILSHERSGNAVNH
jgi:hypothetical protein